MSNRPIAVLTISSDAESPGTPANSAATGDRVRYKIQGGIKIDPTRTVVRPIFWSGWYTTPNVSVQRENNTFRYVATAPAPNPGTYDIVVPDGLYSVGDLQQVIASETTANGHGSLTVPIFTFEALLAIQKVAITVAGGGYQFTVLTQGANLGMDDLLGFTAGTYPAAPTAAATPESFTGQSIANFAPTLSLDVNCSIVRRGYSASGRAGQTILTAPLGDAPANRSFVVRNSEDQIYEPNTDFVDFVDVWLTDSSDGATRSLNGNLYVLVLALEERA